MGNGACDSAPTEWTEAFVQPRHPDYYNSEFLTPVGDAAALHNGTVVTTMDRGRAVSGRVLDIDGNPVAGAIVECGNDFGEDTARVLSGADGDFLMPHAGPNLPYLLVYRPGLPPVIQPLSNGDITGLQIRLAPPTKLRGRLVDENGNALSSAYVSLLGWTGTARLYFPEFRCFSDADGRFDLDVPPGSIANLWVSHDGFSILDNLKISDFSQEHLTTLHPTVNVTGHVTDAATGKPIPKFTVVGATNDPGWATSWDREGAIGLNGHYDLQFVTASPTASTSKPTETRPPPRKSSGRSTANLPSMPPSSLPPICKALSSTPTRSAIGSHSHGPHRRRRRRNHQFRIARNQRQLFQPSRRGPLRPIFSPSARRAIRSAGPFRCRICHHSTGGF